MPNGYRTNITNLNYTSEASIAHTKKRARGIGFDESFSSLFNRDNTVNIS